MVLIKSFNEFLNEFELEGEVQQGKPSWNGKDYLDVDGNISINHTDLTEFPCIFPEKWDKGFYCGNNKLTSLYGSPREVKGDFGCSGNQLTSLKGAPEKVGGNFKCTYNKLTSLEGAPERVGWDFNCTYNKLTSLKGAPREVRGGFYCNDNKLTSLEGAPKGVKGNFICDKNKNKFTKEDVRKVSNVQGEIYV